MRIRANPISVSPEQEIPSELVPSTPLKTQKPKSPRSKSKPSKEELLSGSPTKEEIIELLPPEIQDVLRQRPDLTDAEALRIATYFSGIGTVEAALPGIKSMLAVEYDPEIVKHHNVSHGKSYIPRDVSEVDPQEVKSANSDLFHASPVCTNFSPAKSFTRTQLQNNQLENELDIKSARAVARVIREAEPPSVSIENAFRYRETLPLEIIKEALDEKGYVYDIHIVNASDLGAAQNRKRMILRAVREGGTLPPMPKKRRPGDWWEAVKDLVEAAPEDPKPLGPLTEDVIDFRAQRGELTRSQPILLGGAEGRNKLKGVRPLNPGVPAFTLTASQQRLRILLPDGRLKLVTPRMLARLMGLPDSFKVPDDYYEAKLVLGNGIHGEITRQILLPLMAAGRRVSQQKQAQRLSFMHKRSNWLTHPTVKRTAQASPPGSSPFNPLEVPEFSLTDLPSVREEMPKRKKVDTEFQHEYKKEFGPATDKKKKERPAWVGDLPKLKEVEPKSEAMPYVLNLKTPRPEDYEGERELPAPSYAYNAKEPWHIRYLPDGIIWLADFNRPLTTKNAIFLMQYRKLKDPFFYYERARGVDGRQPERIVSAARLEETLSAIPNEKKREERRSKYVSIGPGALIDFGYDFACNSMSTARGFDFRQFADSYLDYLPYAKPAPFKEALKWEDLIKQMRFIPPGTYFDIVENKPLTEVEVKAYREGKIRPPEVSLEGKAGAAFKRRLSETHEFFFPREVYVELDKYVELLKAEEKVEKIRVIVPEKAPPALMMSMNRAGIIPAPKSVEEIVSDKIDPKTGKPKVKRIHTYQLEVEGDLKALGAYAEHNIDMLLDKVSVDQLQHWATWYDRAHENAKTLSTRFGVPVDLAAAIIALLSPNALWDNNLYGAEQIFKGRGPAVIDSRLRSDQAGQEQWVYRLFPQLLSTPEKLGSGNYFDAIAKAQKLLSAYLQSGGHVFHDADAPQDYKPKDFKIEVDDPIVLQWDYKNKPTMTAAAKLYRKLTARGWYPRTITDGQIKSIDWKLTDKAPRKKAAEDDDFDDDDFEDADAEGSDVTGKSPSGKITTRYPMELDPLEYGTPSIEELLGEPMRVNFSHLPLGKGGVLMIPPMMKTDGWVLLKNPSKSKRKKSAYDPKVTAFYKCIADPKNTRHIVVLDGHAINIVRGDRVPLTEVKQPSNEIRDVLIEAYQKCAARFSQKHGVELSPQSAQAVTWSAWRDILKFMKEGKTKKMDTPMPEDERDRIEKARERLLAMHAEPQQKEALLRLAHRRHYIFD